MKTSIVLAVVLALAGVVAMSESVEAVGVCRDTLCAGSPTPPQVVCGPTLNGWNPLGCFTVNP